MSAISHPVQDETLSSAEREYVRGLMGLIGRELSLHAGRFEGYARDECGVPGDMTYRILTHGYKHRCAMIASHLIAKGIIYLTPETLSGRYLLVMGITL